MSDELTHVLLTTRDSMSLKYGMCSNEIPHWFFHFNTEHFYGAYQKTPSPYKLWIYLINWTAEVQTLCYQRFPCHFYFMKV